MINSSSSISFDSLRYITSGTFGIVYKIKYNNNDIAIKIFKNNDNFNVSNEINFYKYINDNSLFHPNILNLIGFTTYINMKCLLIELCDFDLMDLINWKHNNIIKSKIDKQYEFNNDNILYIIENIKKGLSFLHNNNIAHLDIKPENILIKVDIPNFIPKICDFGHAILLKNKTCKINDFHGTYFYAAPEIKENNELGFHSDIYSFAITINLLLIYLNIDTPQWIYDCLNKNPYLRPKIDEINVFEHIHTINKCNVFKLNKCNIM